MSVSALEEFLMCSATDRSQRALFHTVSPLLTIPPQSPVSMCVIKEHYVTFLIRKICCKLVSHGEPTCNHHISISLDSTVCRGR